MSNKELTIEDVEAQAPSIKVQAVLREKDAQILAALSMICALKGDLAVANAKIAALGRDQANEEVANNG